MPTYRGDFGWIGRAPHRGCPVEEGYRSRANNPDVTYCRRSRDGWVCTRPPGHTGDHVAHGGTGLVILRWSPTGSLTDSEEGEA
jgi:hypothetical protein